MYKQTSESRSRLTRVWRRLSRLLHSWWRRDAIRAAPSDGQLLRLQPGDLVDLAGTVVEIVERSPGESGVTYACSQAGQRVWLRVRFDGPAVLEHAPGQAEVLCPFDIEVFAVKRHV